MKKRALPVHVPVFSNRLHKNSMVLCEQVQVIDKSRLGKMLCRISNKTLAEVDKALAVSVGINNNFGGDENE